MAGHGPAALRRCARIHVDRTDDRDDDHQRFLAAMAAVRYDRSVTRAKEATLHHDLSVMRDAIEQYTLDKQQAPQSLDDLVSSGYLRAIPPIL